MSYIRGVMALFLSLALLLSGCSLFLVEDENSSEEVCVQKKTLEELGVDVDELLAADAENADESATEETEETTEDETDEGTEEDMTSEVEGEEATEEEANDTTEETVEEEVEEEVDDNLPVKEFSAGELVKIQPKGGNDLTYTYSEPLDENGEWQTTEDDVGSYVVDVTATNAAGSITKQLRIKIVSTNSKPVISAIDDVVVNAGEEVTVSVEVSDADNDPVEISFSGWMDSATKDTTDADVGTHDVTVEATDGKATVTESFKVTVNEVNNAPVLEAIDAVTVTEGDLVEVSPKATDADNDDLFVSYSQPLDSEGKWQTEAGDAGVYQATVTVSDGELEDKQTFSITVENANTAPTISASSVEVAVTAGDTATVTLNPEVADEDGDELEVTYSGFMTQSTKTVSEDDEGDHTVTITVSDGQSEATVDVTVTVTVNQPPEFDF